MTSIDSAAETALGKTSAERAWKFIRGALEAVGTAPEPAAAVADALTESSLRGVDSHGIRLLVHYVQVVEGGRVNPRPRLAFSASGPGTGVVDGDNGFGHYGSFFAIDRAVELARETGIAAVCVIASLFRLHSPRYSTNSRIGSIFHGFNSLVGPRQHSLARRCCIMHRQ